MGQFPLVIGGIAPVVKIDGVQAGQMRFTGPVLADIYLGKITNWSDPAIAGRSPPVRTGSPRLSTYLTISMLSSMAVPSSFTKIGITRLPTRDDGA
jgi:ABC-type phosphate transport system substrate-binding protein